uniref:Uncharacterized protein n=1 Tax=Rhizophora mucronata TaxID=61149 RepID=A0A2P2PNM5_RHIMU
MHLNATFKSSLRISLCWIKYPSS